RNLIVVSSHGLRLRDAAQIPVPPFRSNYQTATHLAATAGVMSAVPGTLGPVSRDTLEAWIREPRVFEIGRTEAVDLTPTRYDATAYENDRFACRQRIANCSYIEPRPGQLFHLPTPSLEFGGAAVVVAIAFVVLISSRVRAALGRCVRWTRSG